MDLTAYFQQWYEYYFWANRRYFDVARGLNPDQLNQPQGQSWGTITGILLHMYGAVWMWMQRVNGISPKEFPPPEEFPDLDVLSARWAGQQEELRRFLQAQTDDSLGRAVAYHNTRGQPFELKLWQILAHVANHATHHRGELAAIFSTMGIPHPEDEANQYFNMLQKNINTA